MTTRQQQSAYLQAAYLQTMGIQVWEPRVANGTALPANEEPASNAQAQPVSAIAALKNALTEPAPSPTLPADAPPLAQFQPQPPVTVPTVAPVSANSKPTTLPADKPIATSAPVFDEEPPMPTDDYIPSLDMEESDASALPVTAPVINVSTLDWPELQSAVSACTACDLHQSRTQTVFGVGNHAAQWMVIGEAPKADEDQQGEPFVGEPGQLLNNMLHALGLQREQVFISNILKCRPSDDRDPRPEELSQCEAYLQRKIALISPKVILAVGAVAAHSLLKLNTPVTKLRSQIHHYGETPVVVTYHPAYLLRKPSEKAKSWQDLRFAAAVVKGEQ